MQKYKSYRSLTGLSYAFRQLFFLHDVIRIQIVYVQLLPFFFFLIRQLAFDVKLNLVSCCMLFTSVFASTNVHSVKN